MSQRLADYYAKKGFRGRVGFGQRPAVIVIDLAKAWTDPSFIMGTDLSDVIENVKVILRFARDKKLPIFFTTMSFNTDLSDVGENVLKKLPHLARLVKGSEWVQLHPELQQRENELLIKKQRASAFFGTMLLSQLIARKVDTLIITGCSTSGCIRATAESAHNYNFHSIVVREAVGDRSMRAHEYNLMEIDARYADVVSTERVVQYLENL